MQISTIFSFIYKQRGIKVAEATKSDVPITASNLQTEVIVPSETDPKIRPSTCGPNEESCGIVVLAFFYGKM